MHDLPFTLTALRAAYAADVRPEDVVLEAYRRIAAVDDPGIFIDLFDIEDVLEQARRLGPFDPARPLWGIPFAVKDNIDVAGRRTTAACPVYAYEAETDAFVVSPLKAAGAIAIGTTNLDQFATGLVGVRAPWPGPLNAGDPAIVPGGSSSGSAVAVGHGLVCFALGTDTAGSGRVPAALNNIVGLKPSLGALSASGVVPACRTLDTISIFALTVEDAHAIFVVAAVHDGDDAFARPTKVAPLSPLPPRFRVAIPDDSSIEFFGDEAQAASFATDVELLRAAGAEIVPVDFKPFHDVAEMLYRGAWVAERYTVIEKLLTCNPDAIHPVTRQIIKAAEGQSAADAFRGIYRLKELRAVADGIVANVDMLCVPTIPTFYTVSDLTRDPVEPNSNLGTYTNFVNLMDLCGIAVPTAPRRDGRPGSVTLLGKAGRDGWLASVALALERHGQMGATGFDRPDAAPRMAMPGPGEMAIAVCGAHMSGLPLNPQLSSRGGRFLEATVTAAEYRLYALDGGPPARPGLIRDTEAGASVPVEIWALPEGEVGSFLAGIPAPLGLGTVTLVDGRTVTGFICEFAGLAGARELDPAAGWRGFLAARQAG